MSAKAAEFEELSANNSEVTNNFGQLAWPELLSFRYFFNKHSWRNATMTSNEQHN